MKYRNILMWLFVVATLLLTVKGALAELEIDNTSVMVNGLTYDAGATFNVSPGEEITVSFTFENTFADTTLGHVSVTAAATESGLVGLPYSGLCTGVDCEDGQWVLTPGDVGSAEFSFTVPFDYDPTISTFDVGLLIFDDGGLFGATEDDFFAITFGIVRENTGVEIIDAMPAPTVLPNTLRCSAATTLSFDIVNTGSSNITPELAVFNTRAVESSLNRVTGEFTSWTSTPVIILEETLDSLAPGERRTESMSIDTSELGTGTHTLYLYIVNPFFDEDEFFVGDSDQVTFRKESCLVSATPAEDEIFLHQDETQTFSVTLAPGGLGSAVSWFIDGVLVVDTGLAFTTAFDESGTYTVGVSADANAGETREWEVTVSNVPTTTLFTLPGFDETEDLANYPDFTIANSAGRIIFTEPVDLTDVFDLDDIVIIRSGFVAVDTAAAPGLAGREAEVTLFGTFTSPVVLVSSSFDSGTYIECATCGSPTTSAGQITFEVPGFSSYRAVEESAPRVTISEISLNNVNRGDNATTTVTITNAGSLDSLTGVVVDLMGVNSRYDAEIVGTVPSTLGPGASATVELRLHVPTDEDSGRHSIGNLRVTSTQSTATQSILLNPRSFLTLDSFKVDGKTSGKLLLADVTEMEIGVKNDYTEDMTDVVVTVTILNVDDDDIEEESTEFDIEEGRTEEVTLEFDLRGEVVDEEEYTVEIVMEGEADDGTSHRTVETRTVQVEREDHQVIIQRASLSSSTLQCSSQTTLQVNVENIGESDEDDVEIKVRSAALGLELSKDEIELEEFSSSDNDYRATFTINAGNAAVGSYPLTVELYRDGDLEDTEEVILQVAACSSTSSGTSQTDVQLAGEDLTQQLEQQLQAQSQSQQNAVRTSFRESSTYVALLAILAGLVFIAVLVSVAVLLVKKK